MNREGKVGAIGGALGIHGNGNPTGKVGDPFHVIVAGGAVARPGGAAVPLAAGNNSGGIGGFFKSLRRQIAQRGRLRGWR